MILTKEDVRRDLKTLPENYKTKELDGLIARYVKEKADVSALREYILTEQDLHRIYFYVSLKQIREAEVRMKFIDDNLLFEDWWHTDELINFVSSMEFEKALDYAERYIISPHPFVRRWGYVLFISKLGRGHAAELLPYIKDDGEYYVRMGEAWLIAELATEEPEKVFDWMKTNGLGYDINGKAIQKICDSFRITAEWKSRFRSLRAEIRDN